MKRKDDIQAELTGISTTIAEHSIVMPFEAPENDYFETFPGKMLSLVQHLENSIGLAAPDEIALLSPLLAGIKNKASFDVPGNYFEQLQQQLSTSVNASIPRATKVVQMNSTAGKPWRRYAAAAAIIGVIGIAGLFWNNLQSDANQNLANKSITTGDTSAMPQLSEATLAGFLNGLPDAVYTPALDSADAEFYDMALLKIDDSKLVNILEDMPEEDLIRYERDL